MHGSHPSPRHPRWPQTQEEIAAACEIFREELRRMYAQEREAARRDLAELAEQAAQAEQATEALRAAAERQLAEWRSLVTEWRQLLDEVRGAHYCDGQDDAWAPPKNWSEVLAYGTRCCDLSQKRTNRSVDVSVESLFRRHHRGHRGRANGSPAGFFEFYSDSVITQSQTFSGLVGAISQVNDKLSFDAAVRYASTPDPSAHCA